MGSSSSSVASSASPSPSRFVKDMTNVGSSSPRTPHRESLKRRPSSGSYSSSGQRRSRAARKPLDEKRVSLRGLTKADGHITRDEARRLCEEELDADLEAAFSRASNSRTSTRSAPLATLSEVRDDEADDYESGNASVRGLIRLARHGDTKSLVAMVDKADGSIDIDGKSSSGKTALISAAEHGHVGTVIALFGRGANLEETDLHGNTALLRAASKGHLEVLVMLLSAGASDVARNDKGESAVVLAAAKLADAKRQTFDQRMQILLTLFERAKPDLETGRIPQYVASDSGVIEHRRTRELLEEWSAARALEKDLHLPSQSEFHKCNLGEFFKTRHASYDMHIWFKVLLLLCFVVYDTYLKHFESSYKTYIVYAVLYFGAYSI
ncbi:Ankyrin repeat domain-containing protein 1 [Hondaea fermentalgiana]|uniref:Ankyrin repeat domain-containing protein 1 n=1 Tax=Hondaea fermentalgiana TaxID=2315210 RepID=A0A2R5G6Z9_9STRA|nr:Ankyrin repeat domain-containing protein 1 [Hondaea fermentalgiana]|eukprot:GBG26832.1 Ankyrin repeat domain-containing protein 1 [Hondaea fermentalgiana]